MSMNAIAVTSRNAAKTASIINPDGSTAWRSVPSSRIFRLRLRPLQGPRWQALSRLQAGQVSWVINNCGNGWSVGRLTASGLMNICDIIPRSSAEPGDLIFFQGTYDTSGASHVGIYVGNGMMIHCGNPISYASIETSYWQSHFYCFGRLS